MYECKPTTPTITFFWNEILRFNYTLFPSPPSFWTSHAAVYIITSAVFQQQIIASQFGNST